MSCGETCGSLEMIGGSLRKFVFNLQSGSDGDVFRMGAYTARFAITSLINRSMAPLLVREMQIVSEPSGRASNTITITLSPKDTYKLKGKYIYQITICSPTGLIDVPIQGEMIIHENIDKSVIENFAWNDGSGESIDGMSYLNLTDKPQIESVSLVGNKSFDALGISHITPQEIDDIII